MARSLDTKNFIEALDKGAQSYKKRISEDEAYAKYYFRLYSKTQNKDDKKDYIEKTNEYRKYVELGKEIIKGIANFKTIYGEIMKNGEIKRLKLFEEGKSPEEMRKYDKGIEESLNEIFINPCRPFYEQYLNLD